MAPRSEFDPLGAGAVLLTVLVLCVGVGAAIGAAAGDTGVGVAIGAVVGIPMSVGAVIVRYRDRT